MRDLDLLVVGDCNPDLVMAGRRVRPEFGQGETWVEHAAIVIGGTSSITACGGARLGLRTAMAGVVGDDLFGRFMLAELAALGVDTGPSRVDPACPTGVSAVLVEPGDRATLTFRGTIGGLRAEMIPDDLLARARHVHTGGWFLQGAAPVLADILRRARAAGALALTGLADVAEAARMLAAGGAGAVVVKCGREGVLAVVDGALVTAPALTVEVCDTIGAGDSTNAGWLAGVLNGWPAGRCAALAAACGSLSTRARGGTAGQPTLAEAIAAL